jgi:Cd2+/Zn2+-exporting ATPase/Cu+-exporting ATPase
VVRPYDRSAAPARTEDRHPDGQGGAVIVGDARETHGGLAWQDIARIALVGLGAIWSWFHLWRPAAAIDVVALLAVLIGGYPIFREALADLLGRRMTMELSMTIALVAALVIGEFFTASLIAFFVLVAEVLEGLTVGRGRRAIADLLDLLPREVFLRAGNEVTTRHASDLRTGDVVVIKPGARIPVDGLVVAGHSFVDQGAITGESLPVEKVAGAEVYAGTINQSGTLEVRTERLGRETAFGQIVEAVETAERSRAPIQKTADRLSAYIVSFAIVCAILTFLVTRNARATIAVVIVAGACGVAAGTPLAILGAIGRAAKAGAIIKGGVFLEKLWDVDTVVLDKTGTLTFGRPEVTEVMPTDGVSADAVLQAAAIAERPSEHPIAQAILKRAAQQLPRTFQETDPVLFDYTPGKGVASQVRGDVILVGNRALLEAHDLSAPDDAAGGGETEVFVARGGRLLGTLRVADVVRPEAAQAIRALKALGLRTILLTGDARPIALAIGRQLGIDEIDAQLLPEQKLERIRELLSAGHTVVMVGDGINDAPALALASVGVAMGSGTDVARETADVVLLGNDLLRFAELLTLARRCRRIIMANFLGTLAVDGAGVALAAFGLLDPALAAFIHVSSELAFILNSARLVPGGRTNHDTEGAGAKASSPSRLLPDRA